MEEKLSILNNEKTFNHEHILSAAVIRTGLYPPEEKPSFSQMEINHIRVTTPGLFDNDKLLELHLEQIPDTPIAFHFPEEK
jgi:hypothetical protein